MNKGVIIGIIAIVIVLTLVFIAWGTGAFESPYWETENEFGIWQEELIIEFEDGTTESLKIIEEGVGKPFTVTYGGKAISKVTMRLGAKVTGTGYDGAEIYCQSVGYDVNIKGGGISKTKNLHKDTIQINVPVGISQQLVYGEIFATYLEETNIPAGSVTLEFAAKGTVEYKGYPDGGDWVTATLPPPRTVSLSLTRTPTGAITVILSSEYTT